MTRQAVRGISAPPEVVVDTATDPERRGAWLPPQLGVALSDSNEDMFDLRLTGEAGGDAGRLRVHPGDSGGSSVQLDLPDGLAPDSPEDILRALEREVTDNFNAG